VRAFVSDHADVPAAVGYSTPCIMSLRWRKFGNMLAGAAPLLGAVISMAWLGWSSEAGATSMLWAMATHPIGAIALIQTLYTALLGVLWLKYQPFTAPEGVTWPKVSVIIPAYNEGPMVGRSIRSVAACAYPKDKLEVIVVDDGSRDDTARVAAEHRAWPIRLPVNRGGGFALRVGFAAARRLGARYVITLDADGQHRFADLPSVLAPLRRGAAHVVIGSRRLGRSRDASRLRNLGVRVFSAVLTRLSGQRITDCASGLRGLDLASLGALSLRQRRHHTAELILEAARRNLVIVEVPITIDPRRRGASKKGSSALYALRFAATILSTWLRC
jgi:hypothetical protein